MTKTFFAIIGFIIFFSNGIQAQEQKQLLDFEQTPQIISANNFFGAAASSYSGVGISYIHYFSPNYHFKLTAVPYWNKEEKTNETGEKDFNNTLFINCGTEIRKNFAIIYKRGATFQFYNVLGGSYWYYKKERPFNPEDNIFRKWFAVGIGLGVGFLFVNKVSVNFDLVYQYSHWLDYGKRRASVGGGASFYIAF
jgi:hypothetical protein